MPIRLDGHFCGLFLSLRNLKALKQKSLSKVAKRVTSLRITCLVLLNNKNTIKNNSVERKKALAR